ASHTADDRRMDAPSDTPVEPAAESPRRAKLKRYAKRYLPPAIGVVAVVVIFVFVLPSIADYRSVLDAIRTLTASEALLLGLLVVLNIATNGPPMMASLPG